MSEAHSTPCPSLVYFIQVSDCGPIKIGFTNRPVSIRFANIQNCNPFPVRLLGVMDGNLDLEKQLHSRFRNQRLFGEWFSPSKRLLEFISKNTRKVKTTTLLIGFEPTATKSKNSMAELIRATKKLLAKQGGKRRYGSGRLPALDDPDHRRRIMDCVELRRAGMTARQIAAKMNVCRATVHNWIKMAAKQCGS